VLVEGKGLESSACYSPDNGVYLWTSAQKCSHGRFLFQWVETTKDLAQYETCVAMNRWNWRQFEELDTSDLVRENCLAMEADDDYRFYDVPCMSAMCFVCQSASGN